MTQSMQSPQAGVHVFGIPLGGFGLFATVLLTVATGFFTFFLSTCVAIFSLLFWNVIGGHSVNYADSYLYVGFPAGCIALTVAAIVLAAVWVRSKMV